MFVEFDSDCRRPGSSGRDSAAPVIGKPFLFNAGGPRRKAGFQPPLAEFEQQTPKDLPFCIAMYLCMFDHICVGCVPLHVTVDKRLRITTFEKAFTVLTIAIHCYCETVNGIYTVP